MNHFGVLFALVIEIFYKNIPVNLTDEQPRSSCSCRSPVRPVKSSYLDEEDEMRRKTTREALWVIFIMRVAI